MPEGKKNNLILSEVSGQLPEELAYQNKMRLACFNGVSESDVAEVVKGIVKRAKDGDEKAIANLFEYVMGVNRPVKFQQMNHFCD